MKTFANLDDFASAAGPELGPTDWTLVDQHRMKMFAGADKPAAVIESIVRYVR